MVIWTCLVGLRTESPNRFYGKLSGEVLTVDIQRHLRQLDSHCDLQVGKRCTYWQVTGRWFWGEQGQGWFMSTGGKEGVIQVDRMKAFSRRPSHKRWTPSHSNWYSQQEAHQRTSFISTRVEAENQAETCAAGWRPMVSRPDCVAETQPLWTKQKLILESRNNITAGLAGVLLWGQSWSHQS